MECIDISGEISGNQNFIVGCLVTQDNAAAGLGNTGDNTVKQRGNRVLGRDNGNTLTHIAGAVVGVVNCMERNAFSGDRSGHYSGGMHHNSYTFF